MPMEYPDTQAKERGNLYSSQLSVGASLLIRAGHISKAIRCICFPNEKAL